MSAETSIGRDLDLLFEVGSLRYVPRGWQQYLGVPVENDLEHTLRVAYLALIIARREGGADEGLLLRTALLHDLAETRTGDASHSQKRYRRHDDGKALRDALGGTSLEGELATLTAYEQRESPESRIVKDADTLEVDLELRELERRGMRLSPAWQRDRLTARASLHTGSAKQLWDGLQGHDPDRWHFHGI